MSQKQELPIIELISGSERAKSLIDDLFKSWSDKSLVGFNWNAEKTFKALHNTSNRAILNLEIKGLVIYKESPPEAEIYLVFKQAESPSEIIVALLSHLFNASSHISTWHLEVHEENRAAISLYERVGFEKTHVRKNYYPDGRSALIYTRK